MKVKRLSAGPALRGKRLVPLLTFELRHSIILTNSARERACVLSIARAVTAVAASPIIYHRTDSFTFLYSDIAEKTRRNKGVNMFVR